MGRIADRAIGGDLGIAQRHRTRTMAVTVRGLHLAAVQPDYGYRVVFGRQQRYEAVFCLDAIAMRGQRVAPGFASVQRLRQVHVVVVGTLGTLHQPMCRQSAARQRDQGWEVRPVDEPVLAFGDGLRLGPRTARERRESQSVATGDLFDPAQQRVSVAGDDQVGLGTAHRRR